MVQNAEHLVSKGYYSVSGGPRKSSSFGRSLTRCPTFPIIAEVKLSSPSRGVISRHSPCSLASQYLQAGAACLSVLTEPHFFGGSLEHLRSIASMGVPTLMKDIVVSRQQIEAASALGADAILLIQSVWEWREEQEKRDDFLDYAHSLGLEVILEVSDERELELASSSSADMIGINQRDLSDLTLDKSKGMRMLPLCRGEKRPIIVMSGLENVDDVKRVRGGGAHAVLIGTRLSHDDLPGEMLKSLVVSR